MSAAGTTTTAVQVRDDVRARRRSAEEVVRESLARIEATEARLHAFLQTFPDEAVAHARRIDALVARGRGASLPLAGVPVALKDNICLSRDVHEPGDALGCAARTTCASRMLGAYQSPFTATAAARLIDAGAVIVGKTNLDEFAMGSSTENSAFGPTRNPWDLGRVPGGSSGGSAAAVAARACPVALGSDTGGSIRQPAAFCGVVGVKPTYGRVSRHGLVAFASSLDQIGPLCTSVADAALVLEVISGEDLRDSTSAARPAPPLLAALDEPIDGLTLGVPRQAHNPANHPGVTRVFDEMVATFGRLGARIVEVDLPIIAHGIAAYYIVAPAEAASNLARYDGVRYGRRAEVRPGEGLEAMYTRSRAEGFGPEVKRRIMLGTHVLRSGYHDAYYTTACRVRRRVLDDFRAAFAGGAGRPACHGVLLPSTPGLAFEVGAKSGDPLAMYAEDLYTVCVNLAGLPGVSLPAGFVDGPAGPLPVGVQVIAPAFEEGLMLRVARLFERATDFHSRAPTL